MTGPPNEMLDFMRHSELPSTLPKPILRFMVRAAMNISVLSSLYALLVEYVPEGV